jgi:hypothetical protein
MTEQESPIMTTNTSIRSFTHELTGETISGPMSQIEWRIEGNDSGHWVEVMPVGSYSCHGYIPAPTEIAPWIKAIIDNTTDYPR